MATGRTKMAITDNQPIGDAEFQLLIDTPQGDTADAGEVLIRDTTNRAFLVGPEVGFTYASGPNEISQVAISNRRYGGYWQSFFTAWDETDNGMTAVPFEDDGAATYFIGLRHSEVPVSATLRRSTVVGHTFDRVAERLGFTTTITTVTNPVPAAGLLFTVTSDDLGPGFANVSDARPATVWLVNPATATTEAVFSGNVVWDGVNLEVQATHYFGQVEGSHSTTVGDYVVFIHGLSINKVTDLSTINDGGGQQIYLLLGSFDSSASTFNTSGQIRVPSLGQLNSAEFVGSIQAALRAGAAIGSYEATRDWNDPSNVTVNTVPDPVTFTFTDPLLGADNYIFSGTNAAGGIEPRLAQGEATGGLVASILKSQATATYYVIAEVAAGASSFEYRFTIVPAAGFTVDQTRRLLRVYQFDFTTGTGAVATETAFDLNLRRGIANGSLIGIGDDSTGEALTVHEMMIEETGSLSELIVRARDTESAATFTVSPLLQLTRDFSPDLGILQLHGIAGNLSNPETVQLVLGGRPATGGEDYEIRAGRTGATRFAQMNYSTSNLCAWGHDRTDGESVDSTGAFQVEDLHLTPTQTNGKLVWRQLPIAAVGGDSQWTYSRTNLRWENTDVASNRRIQFDIPASIMPIANGGTRTRITKVRFFGGVDGAGMGAGDAVDVDLFRVDLVAGGPPTVTLSASLANASVVGAGAGEDGAFAEGSAAALGEGIVADIRYLVEASSDVSGGNATAFYVYAIWVEFRVFQGFPS